MDAFYKPNPLVYRCGVVPGINFAHPAASRFRFSAVAMSGPNMVDLATGFPGVPTASVTAGLSPSIGNTCIISGAGAFHVAFANKPTLNDPAMTLAVIMIPQTDVAGRTYLTSGPTGGFSFNTDGSGNIRFNVNTSVSITSATPIAINIPYFAVMTGRTGVQNFLVKRLDTGAMNFSRTTTACTPAASNGTYEVGDDAGASHGPAQYAAVMMSATCLSLADLIAWADDPWSFWYPQPEENWVGAAALVAATLKRPTRNLYFR